MLVSPELMMHLGPPPQEILDQLCLWKLLMCGFGAVLMLQVVAMDMAGAMLTVLLLAFGWIMLRDGMVEMAKYALIYAVLCGLNFFFEILPLFSELSGRVTRRAEFVAPSISVNGTRMTTYTLATQTSSFFDASKGVAYNAESLAMLVAPLCMGLGTYLAANAHNEIQRFLPFPEDWEDVPAATMPSLESVRGATLRSGSTSESTAGREAYVHFSGQPHKLDDS
mmetsp:Transcript_12513/g.29587  ORF Transcript_12513/g.29587 Transcript_12513/m.29587 type:complete len:224 (+) Transcript_12513:98-769(+)